MGDDKVKELLNEIESKRKLVENIANMKAIEFVSSNDQTDRFAAQQYMRDADLWREAAVLVRKYYALAETCAK